VVAIAAASGAAHAQERDYESREGGVTVFSDRPSPGAQPVPVPTPNVIATPRVAAPQAASAPAEPPSPAYRRLRVVQPGNDGTVHSNTGAFTLTIDLQPALRTAAGDRVRVKLDGRLLPRSCDGTSIDITESDWAGAADADTIGHRLQVAVVDREGRALIESPTVSFYRHSAATRVQRRR
jgi:hypothetical protein